MIRKNTLKKIEASQRSQKKAIDKKLLESKKLLKPAFSIGDIVKRYRDFRGSSWSGKLEDLWEGYYTVTEDLKKGNYVITGEAMDGRQVKKIIHGNRLRLYKTPDVGWKLDKNYKRTVMEDLEKDLKNKNKTGHIMQNTNTQGLAATRNINAHLGPNANLSPSFSDQDDKELLVSFDDHILSMVEVDLMSMPLPTESNFQVTTNPNYFSGNPAQIPSTINEIDEDVKQLDNCHEVIRNEKKKNHEILLRLANNIAKVCNDQLKSPSSEEEYKRYVNLRGTYIASLRGHSRSGGKTLAIKHQVKKVDFMKTGGCPTTFRG